MHHRNRITLLQIIFPLKALLGRLSVFLMVLAAILVIFLSRTNPNLTSAIRAKITDITVPVQNSLSLPLDFFSNLRQEVTDITSVYKENRKLKKENASLKKTQEISLVLANENQSLRKLLNFTAEPGIKYITGRIAGESAGPYIRSAFFTEGEKAGIRKGLIVINEDGVVGRIMEVGTNTSRVLLITDINSRIPVVTGEANELAIAVGNNGPLLQLLYLPEGSKIKIGEEVYTSGDGQFFPPGLLIGYIESINDKSVIVRPAVDWGRLVYVSVVDYGAAVAPVK